MPKHLARVARQLREVLKARARVDNPKVACYFAATPGDALASSMRYFD
jgi:hypothetical protein